MKSIIGNRFNTGTRCASVEYLRKNTERISNSVRSVLGDASHFTLVTHGGPGSGDPGHGGRPGQVGGSTPGQGGPVGGAKVAGATSAKEGEESKGATGLEKLKEHEQAAKEHGEGELGQKPVSEMFGGHGGEEMAEPVGTSLAEIYHKGNDVLNLGEKLPSAIKDATQAIFGSGKVAGHAVEQHAKQLGEAISKNLHGHGLGAHAAGTATAKGAAGAEVEHEEEAHGGHEGGEEGHGEGHEGGKAIDGAHEAFNLVGEALGTILGANTAGLINKISGLDKMKEELYDHIKEEYGAAAPYIHAASTGIAIIVKSTLGKILNGTIGGTAGALSGGYAGYAAAKTRGGGKIAQIGGALAGGVLGGAAGYGLGKAGPMGEELAEKFDEHSLVNKILGGATEGIKGFGGFMSPGISLASMWVLHGLAHTTLTKTGLVSSAAAKKAGDIHRHIADTKTAKATAAMINQVGEHLGHLTKGHFIREGKALGRGIAKTYHGVKGIAGTVRDYAEGLSHPEEILGNTTGLPATFFQLPSLIGNAPVNPDESGIDSDQQPDETYPPQLFGQPSPQGQPSDKLGNLQTLDLNNPAVQMYTQLLRRAIIALMQTDLWHKLNTPAGAHIVAALMNAGEKNQQNDNQEPAPSDDTQK